MPLSSASVLPDGVDPAIDGVDGARADSRESQRGWLTQRGVDEAAHREFRGHAAALGAAHAVGKRGDHAGS